MMESTRKRESWFHHEFIAATFYLFTIRPQFSFEQQGPEWDRGRKKNAALIIVVGFLAASLLWLIIHGILMLFKGRFTIKQWLLQ